MKGAIDMVSLYITSVSGWVLVVLLIVTVLYPFLLRSGALGPVQPFLQRMRFHYWLGYSIAGIMLIHSLMPMFASFISSVNTTGLYLATGAFLLVFVQVSLGRRLSWPKLPVRRAVRRWHFWVMVGIVAFVIGHIAFNSVALHTLAAR